MVNECLGLPLKAYASRLLSQDSKHAEARLLSAKKGVVALNHFGNTSIDFTKFDWVTGSDNRNWWWQLQQLPFLQWFAQSANRVRSREDVGELINWIENAIDQWSRKIESEKSPLAWHDHAAALRLRNFVDLYVLVKSDQLPHTEELASSLNALIIEHARWLEQPNTYSRHTNHGYDQAEVLYKISIVFPEFARSGHLKCLALERLYSEISFAFTDEGVHKENSPGYHDHMLRRIAATRDLDSIGRGGLESIVSPILVNGKAFLTAVTMPDGTVPPIGDTQSYSVPVGSERSVCHATEKAVFGCTVFDYSASGYVVIEAEDEELGEMAKLIIKAGHLSDYHRHDDDLSIFWQLGNTVVLGDAGLYSHNETEARRRWARSPAGHNVPYVTNCRPIRKRKKLVRAPRLAVDRAGGRVIATSSCYEGVRLRRVINFANFKRSQVVVEDMVTEWKEGEITVGTNWLVPDVIGVVMKGNFGNLSLSLKNGRALCMLVKRPLMQNVVHGWSDGNCEGAFVSRRFGHAGEAVRVRQVWEPGSRHRVTLKVGTVDAMNAL